MIFAALLSAILLSGNELPTANLFGFSPKIAEGLWEMHPDYSEDVGKFTCDQQPLRIEVDLQNKRYVSTFAEYRDEADILSIEDGYFWIRYDGEQRLDDAGMPVEWAWVLIDNDSFYWVRRDWYDQHGLDRGTTRRRRCPQPEYIS